MSRSPQVRKEIRALKKKRAIIVAEMQGIEAQPFTTNDDARTLVWCDRAISRLTQKIDDLENAPKHLTAGERDRIVNGESLVSVMRRW